MNRTIPWLGGRAPPSRKTPTPASGSRSRASARGFRARGPSAAAAHRSSAPGAPVHLARPAAPSAARSPPCTRFSRQSTRWPPTATDAPLDAPIPAGPRVPGLPVNTGSTFPWPHPLKPWSLRESRGGSQLRQGLQRTQAPTEAPPTSTKLRVHPRARACDPLMPITPESHAADGSPCRRPTT
jgi:hypothetical protein